MINEQQQALIDNFYCYTQWIYQEVFDIVDTSDFNFELCSFLSDLTEVLESGKTKTGTIEAPVQHGKTTRTLIWATWCFGRTQGQIPINYFSASDTLCKQSFKEFYKIVCSPAFRFVFGDFADRYSVRDSILSSPKLATIGFRIMGGGQVGFPSSISIIDDPYRNREDAFSKASIEKVQESFSTDIYTRLTVGWIVLVICSRWHPKDLIGEIKSDPERWNSVNFARSAILPNNTALCPNWRPLDWLLEKKALLGDIMFAAQYQQDPVESLASPFSMSMIKRIPAPEDLNYFITCDPANSKTTSADNTAILVFGVGYDRKIYLVDGIYDKLAIDERTEKLQQLNALYKPYTIGYERYGMQVDIDYIQRDTREKGLPYLPIVELGGRASKEDRITRLVGYFVQEKLFFPEDAITKIDWQGKKYELTECLIRELLDFPMAEHDDGIDCLSRIADVEIAPKINVDFFAKNQYNTRKIQTNKERGAQWFIRK